MVGVKISCLPSWAKSESCALNAEDKAIPLHFDGLNNAIRCKSGGVEVVSQFFDGLVVEAVNHHPRLPDDLMEFGARI